MSAAAAPMLLALAVGHVVGFALLVREALRARRLDRAMERLAAHRLRSGVPELPHG